jgi:general stress protein 26
MDSSGTPVERLNQLIRDFELAMFATVHTDGSVHSRPMATGIADANGYLWFFTVTNTDKVDAIRENDNVAVAYADPASQRYVSVSGRAQLLNNPEKKKELWTPRYQKWLSRELEDPKLVLIRVLITGAEYWDASTNTMAHLSGFERASFSGEHYQAAEAREMEFPENRREPPL